MRVSEGRVGRVFVVRLEDGDRLPEVIEDLAKEKGIAAASVILLGGVGSGKVVVGPRTPAVPPKPMITELEGVHEIAGVGTIFSDEDGPKLHLHGAIGRGDEAMVGCPRGGATVFCVLEVVIFEITGTSAARTPDPDLGLKLLSFVKG